MFYNNLEAYKGTEAYTAATLMPVILENGRKVFGPPPNFGPGPKPTYLCELYVTRIPQQLDELSFLVWLHRIGKVYEFRLMMDSGNSTRGYAFIKFCRETEALAAFELLKYVFVNVNGSDLLSVYRSQGKNRLYISGIPRSIPLTILENSFKMCFPKMESCTAYPPHVNSRICPDAEVVLNRGFAFIEFDDHESALEAKKKLTPGRMRMWGVDLRIQWAKPKEELQPAGLRKTNFSRLYPRLLMPNDFCARLRLFCLANNWCIPIVVYGRSFRSHHLQYAGVLLKNPFSNAYSFIILEIIVATISDIHLLVCEVAVRMIERHGGIPQMHALFRASKDNRAELVYIFKTTNDLSYLRNTDYFFNLFAITELAHSMQLLAMQNSEKLLTLYKSSFLSHDLLAKMLLNINEQSSVEFYAVLPKFRNNTRLNNNFNDIEITLLLSPSSEISVAALLAGEQEINYQIGNNAYANPTGNFEFLALKSQHCYGAKYYVLRYVDLSALEMLKCYHAAQRINSNPIFITGQSYQKSIYN